MSQSMNNSYNDQLSLYDKQGKQLHLLIPDNKTSNYFPPELKIPHTIDTSDPISILSLPIRIENALTVKGKIRTVGEFIGKTDKEIKKISNIGPKIQGYLMNVKKLIEEYAELTDNVRINQSTNEYILSSNDSTNIITENEIENSKILTTLLELCKSPRAVDVIVRRYGLRGGDKETLDEIGHSYGVTRERIRQIQSKSLKQIFKMGKVIIENVQKQLEEMLYKSGGLISEEEADKQILKKFDNGENDGSAILDFFVDLNLIQTTKVGDISIYSPLFGKVKLGMLVENIIDVAKSETLGISLLTIKNRLKLLKKINDIRFNPDYFILKYCWIDPRIEEVPATFADNPSKNDIYFRHYSSGSFVTKGWIARMMKVLDREQSPLHFTEITNKLNDLPDLEKKIDVRRVLSILIESNDFAHVGIRGTYGLTSWGLRKETMPQLIEECIKKAGFPLHVKQIYNYISKYKETKLGNVLSVLESNKNFVRISRGTYGMKDLL